ncbi:MAG: hypothetical protein EOP54_01865 [Sphingobacteriales bacterium]|nr:MAG: hypothetical protein EOP54_01865 [Sphingobacteriales bacterium]
MKIALTKYGLFLYLFFSFFTALAQNPPVTPTDAGKLKFGSDLTYIFKVPDDSVLDYCYKGKSPQAASNWLQTPAYVVITNKTDSLIHSTQIPVGHYLMGRVSEGNLNFSTVNTSTLSCNLVNMERDKLLIIRDKTGKMIEDAIVKIKGKTIPFNKQLMVFLIAPGQNDTVEIRSGLSLHYFISGSYSYANNNYRNSYYDNQIYYQSPEYRGYLVTNQPSYKPGDTLKYKAHLLNKAGKPATDTFELQLQDYNRYQKMRMHKISPQAPGVYFGEFVLGDTVLPDRQYALELFHAKKGTAVSQQFKVEDYLLDDTYLKVKSENLKHYRQGDSVILYAFAHNANGLPLTDGEIDLWVLHNSFNAKPGVAQIFVPDTLYRAKLIANPEGDTKIAFSTSIFPGVKNMAFNIKLSLRNTQGEQKDTLFTLHYVPEANYFKIEEHDNTVSVQLIKNKQSVSGKGYLYNNKDSFLVNYPFELDIKPNDTYYQFTEIDDSGRVLNREQVSLKSREPLVEAQYIEDTAIFKLANPKQKTIRYALFKGNDLLTKGTVARDTLIKIRTYHNETVTMEYVYESNNVFEKKNAVAFILKSRINIKLKKKDIIYPGQTDTLELSVQDAEKKAIAGINMTVLAFNSNFQEDFVPQLSSAGLIEPGLKATTVISQFTPLQLSSRGLSINQAWAKNLSLDTAYFYKNIFLSKAPYTRYVYATKRKDIAQLAVYIKTGSTYILPEYIMQEYNVPLYVKKATITTNPNAVSVHKGKYNLWVRTGKQLFRLYNVDLEEGKKTLLFINPDTLAHYDQKISVAAKMTDTLQQWEKEAIMARTLQINNERGADYTIRQSGYDFRLQEARRSSGYHHYDYEDNYGYGYNNNYSYNYHTIAPVLLNNNIDYFQQGNLKITFAPEANYLYAIRPGMFRMEKMKPDAYLKGNITDYGTPYNFSEELSPLQDWDSLMVNPVPKKGERQRSRSVTFITKYAMNTGIDALLRVNASANNLCAATIFIPKDKNRQPIVIGSSRSLPFTVSLPAGTYDMHIYWNDSTFSSTSNIVLKPYGINSIWIPEQALSRQIPKAIIPYVNINYYVTKGIARHRRQAGDALQQVQLNGWITDENDRKLKKVKVELFAGEQVLANTVSDRKGRFNLGAVPAHWAFLKFTAKGFKDQLVQIEQKDLGAYGLDFKIVMEKKSSVFPETVQEYAAQMLETFIDNNTGSVRNYGDIPEDKDTNFEVEIYGNKMDKRTNTGSATTISSMKMSPMRNYSVADAIQGAAPGINLAFSNGAPSMAMPDIRGSRSAEAAEELKDNESVFGSEALLNTQKGNDFIADFLNNMQSASGMRRNFRDWAIWEPNLWTDANGKATFSVQYPDNTTAWKTYVLTMDNKGISASNFSLTRAFKPLSASLGMPAFLRYGDSVELIGKVINHTGKAFNLATHFKSRNLDTSFTSAAIQNGKIEKQFIAASFANTAKDTSITASYQLTTEEKYEDGEQKTIPVYPVGLVERKGFFTAVMGDTTIHTKARDLDLPFTGNAYVSIEGNLLEVMLSEIEQLKVYPHGCTEQLTSILLSVYYEEQVKQLLGSKEFNNTKEKKEILAKLVAAQNADGSFGWFGGNSVDFRVTNYVLSTLQKLNDNSLSPVVNKGLSFLNYNLSRMNMQDLISSLGTLSAAGYSSNYAQALERIKEEKLNTYNRFAVIKIKKERNLPYRAALDSIMIEGEMSRSGLKWGDESYDWYRNELATTLLAYEVIKADSIYSGRKKDIVRYLLAKRTNGYYENTAESGLILSTLLPDMIVDNPDQYAKREPTIVVLSGSKNDTIKAFPAYLKISDKNAELNILKRGLLPVYISVAYEYFNQAPEAKKGAFTVHTSFMDRKDQSLLQQGEVVIMRVAVEVKEDAEYVMIEAPLPAGCMVRNKRATNAYESSRANFKEKTSIYCGYLPKGTHHFDIELQARYKGSFTINPASASLMYYADEQGNNEVKKVWIK